MYLQNQIRDISGTITAGGTAQTICAANANRKGWWLQNNHASLSLWTTTIATAVASQPSLEIKAGELYEAPMGAAGTGAISIYGGTTAQPFTAREW